MTLRLPLLLGMIGLVAACGRQDHLGKEPSFTPSMHSLEHKAMQDPGLPFASDKVPLVQTASLWNNHPQSLLGDRRAMRVRLTAEGQEIFAGMAERHRQVIDALFAPLSHGDLDRLAEMQARLKNEEARS